MGVVGGMPPGMVIPPGMGVPHPVGIVGGPMYTQGQQQQASSAAPPSQMTAATTPEDVTARLERKVTFSIYFSHPCLRTRL